MATRRFRDHGERQVDFGDLFLVRCPRCGRCARVAVEDTTEHRPLFQPRRLTCTSCALGRRWEGRHIVLGGPTDWYFGLPLWLQTPCAGETLWAYNAQHLALLESYVKAGLRERTPNVNRSVASRLPRWIKRASNCEDVMRAVELLKARLSEC